LFLTAAQRDDVSRCHAWSRVVAIRIIADIRNWLK
jgi:hypothetical protein